MLSRREFLRTSAYGIANWAAVEAQRVPFVGEIDWFAKEKERRPDLLEILFLMGLINSYSRLYTPVVARKEKRYLGTHLRETGWYREKKGLVSAEVLAKVDSALNFVERGTYAFKTLKPQAIQCVGWVVLLSSLGHESSPKYVGNQDFRPVADLLPAEVKRVLKGERVTLANSTKDLAFDVGTIPIGDIKEGDLFFKYDTDNGHVGCILAKKTFKGETALLIGEANRDFDGQVLVSQVVGQTEMEKKLGSFGWKMVVVHK